MLEQDPADFQNRPRVLVHVDVVGVHDDFGFDFVQMGTFERHDTISRFGESIQPTRLGDDSDNVVVLDPGRVLRAEHDGQNG